MKSFKYLIILLISLVELLPIYSRELFVPSGFSTIHSAIEHAKEGDIVVISPGIYRENLFVNKNITLKSITPKDPKIATETIIDGDASGAVITLSSNYSDLAVVDGLTITNGKSRWGAGIVSDGPHQFGDIGSTATIRNCIITNNEATKSGGGIGNCDGLIENCIISNNSCTDAGAGLWHCDGIVKNNLIENNASDYQGGGMCGCGAKIIDNRILNNSASHQGGGINKSSGESCLIEDNFISGNSADYGGGICDSSRANLGLNQLVGNVSNKHDGEIYDFKGSLVK